mmetsp:Transcript_72181/g.172187  ORF Transcript_72181/g.172187 Transcript_72181/m.172187 type:complete len:91 (+) Transcript_72181:91-363(+)
MSSGDELSKVASAFEASDGPICGSQPRHNEYSHDDNLSNTTFCSAPEVHKVVVLLFLRLSNTQPRHLITASAIISQPSLGTSCGSGTLLG